MGIGSCENSVMVEEPPRMPVSGQILCSEFALKSVGAVLSHSKSDCEDLVSSGGSTPSCNVNEDKSTGEDEVRNTVNPENKLINDAGLSVDSSEEENQINTDQCGDGGSGNLVGESELPLEPVMVLANGSCLNENDIDVDDARVKEEAQELLQESKLLGEDDTGKLNGDCEFYQEVIPSGEGCLNEAHGDINACLERSLDGLLDITLAGEIDVGDSARESDLHLDVKPVNSLCSGDKGDMIGDCDLPLEVTSTVSLTGGDYLEEINGDIGDCAMNIAGECSQESKTQVVHEDENLPANSKLTLEVTPVADLEGADFLDNGDTDTLTAEKPGEVLLQRETRNEGNDGNQTGDRAFLLETVPATGLNSGSCLSENFSDIGASLTETSGEFMTEIKLQGMGDVGNTIENNGSPVISMASGGCLNEINEIDVCAVEKAEKPFQESMTQGEDNIAACGGFLNKNHSEIVVCATGSTGELSVESIAQVESDFRNEIRDYELPSIGESVTGLGCWGFSGEIHDNTEGCSVVIAGECMQDSKLQCEEAVRVITGDKESPASEAVATGGCLNELQTDIDTCDVERQNEINGTTVALFASESDMCEKISPLLQPCEIKSEIMHLGEEVSDCDRKNDQNNCISCPLNENIMNAAGVEIKIEAVSQIPPLTILRNKYTSVTPNTCVLGHEQDEKTVHVSSSKGDCVAEIEADSPVLPLEENPCSDRSDFQPCHPIGCTDNTSYERLNSLHENSLQDSVNLSSTVGCLGQTDNQGKDDHGINLFSETKCGEVVPSSFHRNGRRGESNRKPREKKGSRNSRKTTKAARACGGTEIAFKLTKKRNLSRSARSSDWGLTENVTQLFVRLNGLEEVVPVFNERQRKPKGDKNYEKKNKNGAAARTRDSKKKCPASTTKLRLKVKIGKGVDQSFIDATVPELVDISALPSARNGENGAEFYVRSPHIANAEVGDASKAESSPGASAQDPQPIIESERTLVNEKSVEVLKDDYFGVSSDVVEASGGTASSCGDPGTSPDSEVINIVHADMLTSLGDHASPGDLISSKKGNKKDKSPQAERKSKDKSMKHYGRKQKLKKNGTHVGENCDSLACEKEPSIVEPSAIPEESGAGVSKLGNPKKSRPAAKTKGQKLPRGKSQHADVSSKSKGDTSKKSAGKKKINEKSVDDQVASKVEGQVQAEFQMAVDIGKVNSSDGVASIQVPELDLLPSAVTEQLPAPRNAWVSCDSCHKWRRIAAGLADSIEESQLTWTCKDNLDKAFSDCSTPQEKSNSDINAELEISDASGDEDAFGNRLHSKRLELRQPTERQETVTCTSIRTNQFLHRNRKTHTIDEIMVCHCKPRPDGRLGCGENCLNRMLNIECAPGACPCGEQCSNQQFQKRKYAKLEKFHSGKKGFGLKLMEDIPEGKFLIEYVGEVLDMQAYEARQKEYAKRGHKHFYFMTLNGSEVIDACVKGNKGRFINHSCDPNCRTEKWMVNGEICIGLFAMRDMKKGEEVTFDYNYVRVFGAAAKKCHCLAQHCRGYIGGDPLSGDIIIQSDSDEEYPKPVRRTRHNRPGEKDNAVCSSIDTAKQTAECLVQNKDQSNEVPLVLEQSIDVPGSEENPSVVYSEIFQLTEDAVSEPVSAAAQESFLPEETSVKELQNSSSDGIYDDTKSMADNLDDRKVSPSKAHSKVKTSRSPGSVKNAKVENSASDASKVQLAANKSQAPPLKPKKLIEGSFGKRFEAVEEKLNELLDPDGGISRRKDAAKGYLKLLLLTSASGGTAGNEAIQRNRDLSMILDALLKTRSRMVLTDIINKNGLRMLHKIMKQYRGDFKKIPILRKLLKVLEYFATRDILTTEHIREGPPRPGMESFRESILTLTEHDDKQVHQIARNFRDRFIPKHLRRPCFTDRDDNKTDFPRSSKPSRYSPTRNNGSDHYGRFSETRSDHYGRSSEATRSDHFGRSSEGTRSEHFGRSPEATRSDHFGRSSEATRSDHARKPSETIGSDHTDYAKSLTPSVNPRTEDSISPSCAASVSRTSETRIRKRKSRWDQPAETVLDLRSLQHKEQKFEHQQLESLSPGNNNKDTQKDGFCHQLDYADTVHDTQKDCLEDFPPGFSSPSKPFSSYTSVSPDVVNGHPQEKFISRLPVSYGIPMSVVQQFGKPLEETMESWDIAPGMPFYPFPPLPSFPRDKTYLSQPSIGQPFGQPLEEEVNITMECCSSTTGDQPAVQIQSNDSLSSFKRERELSQDLRTRYFKQQKLNVVKLRPSWHWSRNGCPETKAAAECVPNVTNDDISIRSTPCSEDFSNQEHHEDLAQK